VSVSPELAAFLRTATDAGPMTIVPVVCDECGSRVFSVAVDEDATAAERTCVACGSRAFVADSEDYWSDVEAGDAACPCGGEDFEAAVAFSLRDDGEVRWVTVGLCCTKDGEPGVYADWKIDYSPSAHLLNQA
jgi:hypothetical protein